MKENKLFGTDGIRANINNPILSKKSLIKIGEILGFLLTHKNENKTPKKIIIGQDTRGSGLKIAESLAQGLMDFGIECHFIGVIPSGAISFIAQNYSYDLGMMISASHNPPTDNGIKIFDQNGYKISSIFEAQIENLYFYNNLSLRAKSEAIQQICSVFDNEKFKYITYLKENFNIFSKIKNKKIVIDCANGAACEIIYELFKDFDNIKIINNSPNGQNINLYAGSEYPEEIKKAVIENKADLGIAFDGDADRVIFIDEKGQIVDGDAVIALIAIDLQKNNNLRDNQIVATIMSGPALDLNLKPYNIKVLRSDVGDKNVSKLLSENNNTFGGEQSGHLILHDHCHTGDGIIACLYFLSIFLYQEKALSQKMSFYKTNPRVLKDIIVNKKIPLSDLPKTNKIIHETNRKLGDQGRVLFRYSGTEPKARLLVEGTSEDQCHMIAKDIIDIFVEEIKFI